MRSFDDKVEFKSYGLYSEVSKEIKEKQIDLNITVEQIDTIYSWYIKNIVSSLCENNSLQAHLKGLGKIKFHSKKANSRLNHQLNRLTTLVEYYEKVKLKLNLSTLNEEEKDQINKKLRIISIILNKKNNTLVNLEKEYIERLEKFYSKGSISEKNYNYFKMRFNTFKENQSKLYEPIQRILRTHQEGN